MPPKLAIERTVLSFHRQVSMRSAPSGGSLHREPQPLTGGPDVDRELPVATSCAEVREAEEVEGRRFALPLASEVLLGKSPEGDEPPSRGCPFGLTNRRRRARWPHPYA